MRQPGDCQCIYGPAGWPASACGGSEKIYHVAEELRGMPRFLVGGSLLRFSESFRTSQTALALMYFEKELGGRIGPAQVLLNV